jgi:Gas vesicle protein K
VTRRVVRPPRAASPKANAGSRESGAGRRKVKAAGRRPAGAAVPAEATEIEAIRKQIENVAAARPPRWNANPEEVRRAVLKLVLTLVELIRQLLERQAIRRMEAGTLTDDETENVGQALMRLQETIADLAAQFEIPLEELNLDLGPIGKLL